MEMEIELQQLMSVTCNDNAVNQELNVEIPSKWTIEYKRGRLFYFSRG